METKTTEVKTKEGIVCKDYCPQGKDPKTCKFCIIWLSYDKK